VLSAPPFDALDSMPTSRFNRPLTRLKKEAVWLQRELVQASSVNGRDKQLICEMVVIRLHDAWARFCRELVILSAYGHTVTFGGIKINPSSAAITSCKSVVPVLLSTYKRKGRSFEPRWFDAGECVDAAKRLSIMNLSTVAGAIGSTNSPADDIRRVRNFYAHRAKDTATKATATNLFSAPTHPTVFELAGYTSGGTRIIESWVAGLIIVATAAGQ
jgi:hypothetical protein